MEAKQVYEVIQKLVGPIEPVADSSIDAEREENLITFISIFQEMHSDIDYIYRRNIESPYSSAKKLGLMCAKALDALQENHP